MNKFFSLDCGMYVHDHESGHDLWVYHDDLPKPVDLNTVTWCVLEHTPEAEHGGSKQELVRNFDSFIEAYNECHQLNCAELKAKESEKQDD